MKNLLFVLLLFTANVQAQRLNPAYVELKTKAEIAYKAKDYGNCIEYYRKALIIAPLCEECKVRMEECKGLIKPPPPVPIKKYAIGNDFFSFQKSGKWGLMNAQGKLILQPIYESIGKFDECKDGSLCEIYDGKNTNFLLPNGSWVIEPNLIYKPNYSFSPEWSCYHNPLGIFKKNNDYGLINRKGDIILNFSYENIEYEMGSYILTQKGKKGIASPKGIVILEPKYDKIFDFTMDGIGLTWTSEYCAVKNENKYGVINKEGSILIECQYDSIQVNFSVNEIRALKGNKWGVIDSKNTIIIPFEYDEISPIHYQSGGIFIVKIGSKYKIIDNKNRNLTNLKFDKIEIKNGYGGGAWHILTTGYFVGQIEGKKSVFLYDNSLFEIKDKIYLKSVFPTENTNYTLFTLILGNEVKNTVSGIYNWKLKKIVLPFIYEEINKIPDYEEFKSNTFLVSNNQGCALYDLDINDFLTDFIYKKPYFDYGWGENKYLIIELLGKNHKVFIDRKGNVIDNDYEQLTYFNKKMGLFGFKKNGKWGFMDYLFNVTIPPVYDDIKMEKNDTKILVSRNEKNFYINRAGECIENCQ